MLLGRERECARLNALIAQVRAGSSAALVLEGEAGAGKTSLLEYAATHARGMRVVRARGMASERNLPFAGLASLLSPILGAMGALPDPQRAALASALAIGPAVSAGEFASCAATLSLLSAEAARQPVLAVVDDAHWLDAASARAVEFTARRLDREGVGMIIAMRRTVAGEFAASHAGFDPARLDTMVVRGVDAAAARELLTRSGRTVAPEVARRLTKETGGNPLALIELPAALTEAQLEGLATLPDPLPVGAALRGVFALRLEELDAGTRRALLLAAAAPVDLGTLHRAGQQLSLGAGDLTAAEDAGLIRFRDGQVEFAHPLLRSACYYSAAPGERRAAHQALAAASDPERDPIRRAWHLAGAAAGPDEEVAQSLEQAAAAAQGRNAFAAASRAYQRAAELTSDPGRRVPRWIAAGGAAHLSGDTVAAAGLLKRALELAADPITRADAQVMLAHATLYTTPPMDSCHELVAAADAVQSADPARAATLLAAASRACVMSGQLSLARSLASRAARLADAGGAGGNGWLISQLMLASAAVLTGDRAAGRVIVGQIFGHPDVKAPDPVVELVKMHCGQVLMWCEDHQAAAEVLGSSVAAARATGRVADLPYALATLSALCWRAGEWGTAYAHATEAVELAADVATRSDRGYALACLADIEAVLGPAASCREHVAHAVRLARARGIGSILTMAAAAKGLLDLGERRYQLAVAELARAAALTAEHGLRDPNVVRWRGDYIEGLTRLGRLADAREQLGVLTGEAAASGSPWAAAVAARCRGLLQATSRGRIASLDDALGAAGPAGVYEQARTRLCLGQALRAGGEAAAAREHLQQALTAFEKLGARPWAEGAAAALSGLGPGAGAGTALRRDPIHLMLTPQELRVALHVAEGLSNQEVAARLFVSHKTIEVHLGHIYDKLGVRSRTSLARLVHTGELG